MKRCQPLLIHLPLAALCATVALAGCGGDSSRDGAAEVVAVIEEVMAHPTPADCRTLETTTYIEQTKQDEVSTPMEKCEDDARQGPGEAVEVSKVAVQGANALAHVEFQEGTAVGMTALVALVEEDGRWKLDEIVRYLDFDSAQFIGGLESQLKPSIGDGTAACVASRLRRMPSARLEDAFLNSAKIRAVLLESVGACAHRGS